jgi:hypothetical protein
LFLLLSNGIAGGIELHVICWETRTETTGVGTEKEATERNIGNDEVMAATLHELPIPSDEPSVSRIKGIPGCQIYFRWRP